MSSSLSRRLGNAERAAGIGGNRASSALHVITTCKEYWPVAHLFRSPLAWLRPPGTPAPVVDPAGTVYERLTFGQAVADGVVYITPEVEAEIEAARAPDAPKGPGSVAWNLGLNLP